jgi:site-specific recombinase XerD
MRRSLKGIRHQRSMPFTSLNDGVPFHVVQRCLGHTDTSATGQRRGHLYR